MRAVRLDLARRLVAAEAGIVASHGLLFVDQLAQYSIFLFLFSFILSYVSLGAAHEGRVRLESFLSDRSLALLERVKGS